MARDFVFPRRSLPKNAIAARETYWAEFDALWPAMTPLQQAVLKRIISQGGRYRPFDAASLAAYSADAGQNIVAPDAQSALDYLRDKGLVVRLERGRYALEDDSLAEWMAQRFSPEASAGTI